MDACLRVAVQFSPQGPPGPAWNEWGWVKVRRKESQRLDTWLDLPVWTRCRTCAQDWKATSHLDLAQPPPAMTTPPKHYIDLVLMLGGTNWPSQVLQQLWFTESISEGQTDHSLLPALDVAGRTTGSSASIASTGRSGLGQSAEMSMGSDHCELRKYLTPKQKWKCINAWTALNFLAGKNSVCFGEAQLSPSHHQDPTGWSTCGPANKEDVQNPRFNVLKSSLMQGWLELGIPLSQVSERQGL